MRLLLYGQKNIRRQREELHKALLEIMENKETQRVNEVAMVDLSTKLFNHIEDLEHFICLGADVEYAEGDESGLDTDEVHFDKDLFKIG